MKQVVLGAAALAVLLLACQSADKTMPYVKIVSPHSYDTIPRGSVTIKAYATDNDTVTGVEFYANGTLLGETRARNADTFSFAWDTESLMTGSFNTVKAKASDLALNTNTSTIYLIVAGTDTGGSHHFGRITASETWTAANSPHYVDSTVSVENNAVLTIEPGCVVKFATNTGLFCGFYGPGLIQANGTNDSAIIFTSNSVSPAPGDWRFIGLYSLAPAGCELSHCVIEYAGRDTGPAMLVDTRSVVFANCRVQNSGGYGVQCSGNGFFSDFSGNQVTACAGYPLRIACNYLPTIGNTSSFSGNARDAIVLDGASLTGNLTIPDLGLPYYLASGIKVSNSWVLTVSPGCVIHCLPGVEFRVGLFSSGGLIADGRTGRITFTSAEQYPQPGDWRGITFYPSAIDSLCRLLDCTVTYGGGNDSSDVMTVEAKPQLVGDSIGFSLGWGVYCRGLEYPNRDTLRLNNVFYGNVRGDIGP